MRVVLLLTSRCCSSRPGSTTRREQNEHRLALVASEVALRGVGVSCPRLLDAPRRDHAERGLGRLRRARPPSDETNLSAATCSSLERVWRGEQRSFLCLLRDGCAGRRAAAVSGIVTLAHESWHLRGIVNEARTQCYAVQTTEAVARRLGVPPADARAIAARVATDDFRAGLSTTRPSVGQAPTTFGQTRLRGLLSRDGCRESRAWAGSFGAQDQDVAVYCKADFSDPLTDGGQAVQVPERQLAHPDHGRGINHLAALDEDARGARHPAGARR